MHVLWYYCETQKNCQGKMIQISNIMIQRYGCWWPALDDDNKVKKWAPGMKL